MTCRDLIEFLMAYVDGELPPGGRQRFDDHLAACRDCAAYLASYRETVRLGKTICPDESELPCDLPEDLVEAILEARRAGR